MGLPLPTALILIESINKERKGKVLCLGNQLMGFNVKDLLASSKKYNHNFDLSGFTNLNPSLVLDQEIFFNSLGYNTVDTLDVDDYEGANIILDLNKKIENKDYIKNYDLIYDGGTFEHIFNIGTALNNISILLNTNGVIFHSNPCNGYIDHGFFQISPTLYFDYYLQNNFDVISCTLEDNTIGIRNFNINQDLYRTLTPDFSIFNSPKCKISFCARKKIDSNEFITPQQSYYLSTWNQGAQKKYKVEKSIILDNYKLTRKILFFWITIPYLIIKKLKQF